MNTLTKAQKRELDWLKSIGGSCHVYESRKLNIFRMLKRKGFVELESSFGQFQKGTSVSLKEL